MARKIDYANLTADDLQYISDRQWLVAEGDYQGFETSETVKRWRETGEVPTEDQDGDGVEGDAEGSDEEIEYKDAKVADLRAELEDRGLPTDGKKEELIARLEANDLENEEIEEEEEPEEEPES